MAIRDDQFWASFLGIEPSDWNLPGISIRAHVGLIGYRGLWCFRHRDCVAVSAPAGWVSHLQSSLSDGEVNRVLDQAFLADLLGDEIERLIGPAYQGCLEPGAFRPSSTDNVRALEGEDGAARLQLRVQCGDEMRGTVGSRRQWNTWATLKAQRFWLWRAIVHGMKPQAIRVSSRTRISTDEDMGLRLRVLSYSAH